MNNKKKKKTNTSATRKMNMIEKKNSSFIRILYYNIIDLLKPFAYENGKPIFEKRVISPAHSNSNNII